MERIIVSDLDMNSDKLKASIRTSFINWKDEETYIKELASAIVCHVEDNIIGRMANTYGDIKLNNVEVLLEYVAKAGGGNHLEIGTLFGGSAIAVALMKSFLLHPGIIVCIDPLEGYYSGKDISGIPVNPETLFRNIDAFKVGNRILVMKSKSQSYFGLDISFSTAYIDGDHADGVPLKDWNRVKDVVSRYVIFDNWDEKHPEVQKACREADSDIEWKCVYAKGITCVVERKL